MIVKFLWWLGIFSFLATEEPSLREGFAHPPMHARPKVYWWWLNGNTDTIRLREELWAMKNAGIGGLDIFEIGVPQNDTMIVAGPAFMSEASLKAIHFAMDEAGKLNLEVGLNMASSWNAGGSWVLPEHAAKSLYCSKTIVDSRGRKKVRLPFPEVIKKDKQGKDLILYHAKGRPAYYKEVAVLAVPVDIIDTARIIDVSAFYDPVTEVLNWEFPFGAWEIQRYICANSGEQLKLPSVFSKGPIIDHFDSSATAAHFQHILQLIKPQDHPALKSLYLASYEATGLVWTGSLPAAFRKINGYDLYKFLPALIKQQMPAKFQSDLQKTLSSLMINNFYRKGKEIANRYGLKLNSEAGGPGMPLHNTPAEPLEALGALDIPRGEFWNNYHYYNKDSIDIMRVVKEVSAASHIYQRGIVEEESFTSFQHWQEGPFDLKSIADRAFCEGMNRVVVHGFSHNPNGSGYPGIVYHAGTHFNDKCTWWPKIKPFNDYLARISYLLQKTKFVADVIYYNGDQVQKNVAPKNTAFKAPPGYDYEVINTDILLHGLQLKNGLLMLPGGGAFRVLVVDKVTPAIKRRLDELVKQGAVITSAPKKALKLPPDFSGAAGVFDYIHHKNEDLDLYLVRNTTDQWVSRLCAFRQTGRTPEIWDPLTGKIVPVNIYKQASQQMEIPLTLAPYGSFFVVFKKGAPGPHYNTIGPIIPLLNYTASGMEILEPGTFALTGNGGTKQVSSGIPSRIIDGPWQLSFPRGWGAPDTTVLPQHISWTKIDQPGIRYFSGMATYHQTFVYTNPNKEGRSYLDLGKVSKVAEVYLNGKSLGISWALPHRFDITDALQSGVNTLKIEVANVWSNRLTGDAITGEKYTRTNIASSAKGVSWAQTPLVESGLLGPVRIEVVQVVR